jgi:hypothetical protein
MFTDHEPTGTGKARWHLERALTALAIDVEAPMTICTTDGVASRHPEPAAALWLLLDLERAAVLAQTEQISRARAAGHSWDAIAGALALGYYYAVRAEAAFAFATGGHQDRGERLDQPRWSVAWDCAAWGQRITDEGPFNGVREDEKGHRGDCPRHLADIAREDAEWAAASGAR